MSNIIEPKKSIGEISRYKAGKSNILGSSIKLSSNESALGPSKLATNAFIESSKSLSIYPDGNSTILKEKIADIHNLSIGNIFCGAGSDEILTLIANAYLYPGDEVIYSEHAFVVYKIITLANDAIPVPAAENNLKASVDNIISSITKKTKIIFIANPNNPTGSYLNKKELYDLRARMPENVLLVIDGAYAEYVKKQDYIDGTELVDKSTNTIMTRTFSKIYALASLRIGWAYCPDHVIEVLDRIRGPFNLSSAAIYAGSAALTDREHFDESISHNLKEKAYLVKEYKKLGINVIEGVANFILLDFSFLADFSHKTLNNYLIKKNIFLRDVSDYGLRTHLRLSIGTSEENRIALKEIKSFIEGDR